MTADDQTIRPAASVAKLLRGARGRLRANAPDAVLRLARPYVRRHSGDAATAAALARLQADFEHVRKRHTEQIERLEDLVRELVLTAEALRRASSDGGATAERPARQTRDGDVEAR
jgi:hypothetical protein